METGGEPTAKAALSSKNESGARRERGMPETPEELERLQNRIREIHGNLVLRWIFLGLLFTWIVALVVGYVGCSGFRIFEGSTYLALS